MSRPRRDEGPHGGVSIQDENFKHLEDLDMELSLIKKRLDRLESKTGLPRGENNIYKYPRPWNGEL